MTLSYRKILENAGTPPEYPKKEYIYNAYKDGMCKEFSTRDEAEKFSKLIEKKVSNIDLYDAKKAAYEEFYSLVYSEWHAGVREYFSELPDEQFNILYSEAYEDGHSAGYDEVFMYMEEYLSFIEKFNAAKPVTQYNVGPGGILHSLK